MEEFPVGYMLLQTTDDIPDALDEEEEDVLNADDGRVPTHNYSYLELDATAPLPVFVARQEGSHVTWDKDTVGHNYVAMYVPFLEKH